MQSEVLGATNSPDLRAHVIWLPILQKDSEEAAALSAQSVTDARASHYWNPDASLAAAAAHALGIAGDVEQAWDVFLVYGPEARWPQGAPMPAPQAWLHRLQHGSPRWMEPELLRRAVEAYLPQPATK